MSSLSIRSFTLFREEQPVRDALVLFTLTLLLHFLGAMLRLVQELSFFWPLNAVMAGIFARYVWLNRSYFYAVCFAAMLVYDGLTSRWGMGFASLLINFSNIVFIVTLAQLVLWDKRRADSMPGPINALNLFCFCLLAALLCAAVGALGSVDVERATFVPQLADWFSEQFSTAVLMPAAAGAGAGPVNCAWRGGRRRGQHYLPVTGFDLVRCTLSAAADLSADFSHWHRRNTAGR